MDDLTGGARREERTTGTPDATIRDPDDAIGGVAGGGGASGERATGTPNTIYDLSSVLFHALEGGASYDTYIEDAEREGDGELADFFRRVRDEDSERADEARRLLAGRSPTATAGSGTSIEPVEGATAPSEGLAAGAPRREETFGVTEGRPDTDVTPTEPGIGAGRAEPDVSPRTEPSLAREGMEEAPPPRTSGIEEGVLPEREGSTGGTPPREGALAGGTSPEDTSRSRPEGEGPLGRGDAERPEGEREEDKGLLDRAKDAVLGKEDEPRRREGTDRPEERR